MKYLRNRSWSGPVLVVAVLTSIAGAMPARAAGPAPDPPERAATAAFRAGDYAEALRLFDQLYADTGIVVYVRNIARCHQMRREPSEALISFQKYIDLKPDMTPTERREIEIYMGEMRALQLLLTPSKPKATAPPPAPLTVAPVATVTATRPAPPVARPLYRKGWFWGVVGGIAVASVVATVLATGGKSRVDCPLPSGRCQ